MSVAQGAGCGMWGPIAYNCVRGGMPSGARPLSPRPGGGRAHLAVATGRL